MFLASAPSEEDKYKPGTTVNEIYSLCNFDRRMRNVFLKNILIVETNVKSLIAYYFPQKYGHENYLKYSNFDMTKKDSDQKFPMIVIATKRIDASQRRFRFWK